MIFVYRHNVSYIYKHEAKLTNFKFTVFTLKISRQHGTEKEIHTMTARIQRENRRAKTMNGLMQVTPKIRPPPKITGSYEPINNELVTQYRNLGANHHPKA